MNPESKTSIYVCGPTVYDHSHLGHARTYVTVDLINRTYRILGKGTYFVMNITDIDDKIINKANETGTSWQCIAKTYEESFFNSLRKLNVELPDTVIRVSEVIPDIISYIQKLIANAFAYVVADGSVYFDTNNYLNAGYTIDANCGVSSELAPNHSAKLNPKDFALWKGRAKSEVGFDATFEFEGKCIDTWGRPGWHIECSTMINKTIGPDLDIHLGGIDLKFPHHHNEILQAHAFNHPRFLPRTGLVWPSKLLHVGHLNIRGQKMSKSLKNFTTINEALIDSTPNQLRWLFMLCRWQSTMELSDELLAQAKLFDKTIRDFINRVSHYPYKRVNLRYGEKELLLSDIFDRTKSAMPGIFEELSFEKIPELLTELINQSNIYVDTVEINESLVSNIRNWICRLLEDLGFTYAQSANSSVSEVMCVLIDIRSKIRSLIRSSEMTSEIKSKLYRILDDERNQMLPSVGIKLQDTKDSSLWYSNSD